MRAITVPNPKPFTHLLFVLTLVTLSVTMPRALSQGPIPHGYRFVEFDAPGAGTVPYSGTEANSINSRGVSTGDVVDDSYNTRGFVRNRDAAVTVFDAPGANPAIGT
jgi:hypothetical protein